MPDLRCWHTSSYLENSRSKVSIENSDTTLTSVEKDNFTPEGSTRGGERCTGWVGGEGGSICEVPFVLETCFRKVTKLAKNKRGEL